MEQSNLTVPNFAPLGPNKPKFLVTGSGYGPVPIVPYQGINFYSPDLQIIPSENGIGIFVPPGLFGSGPTGPMGPSGPPGADGPTGPSGLNVLTTKGDLATFSTLPVRLPVGANNTILVADSAQASGIKWWNEAILNRVRLTSLTDPLYIGNSGNDFVFVPASAPASTRAITIPDPGANASLILSTSTGGQSITNGMNFTNGPVLFPAPLGGTSVGLTYCIEDSISIGAAGVGSIPSSVLVFDVPGAFVLQLRRVGGVVTMKVVEFFVGIGYVQKARGEFPSLAPIPSPYRPGGDVTLSSNGIYWEDGSGGPVGDPESMAAQPLQWRFRIGGDGFFTFLVTGDTDAGITSMDWPQKIGIRTCDLTWTGWLM